MSSYVITGGAGFIGSHLCKRLLAEGKKIICIDNLITSSKDNIADILTNRNFVFINHDVISALPKIDGEISGIFHLASPASPNAKSPRSYINHPIETLMVNSLGTKRLLDLSREKNSIFVYTSSSEIYGDPQISPQT